MKVTAKRAHVMLKLTRTEVRELHALLQIAVRDRQRSPISWSWSKESKARTKLLAELTGCVDGVLHWGRDPDDTSLRDGAEVGQGTIALGHSSCNEDEDRLLSEPYAVAYREGKKVGLDTSRRAR